jgi:2-oxoisovalerate dehydrogenase E1 component
LAPLFEEYEILCEVLCPTQLYPLNVVPIIESVRQTRRLLVVEEGIGFAAFGSEVIAQLCELLDSLPFSVRRLSSAPVPIPSSAPLERAVLPGTRDVIEAARATVADA